MYVYLCFIKSSVLSKSCLILGSGSDIGKALAFKFAEYSYDIILASKEVNDTQKEMKNQIESKFSVDVNCLSFNGIDYQSHDKWGQSFKEIPDVIISVFGYLGDQKASMDSFEESHKVIDSNYTGHVSLLNLFSQKMVENKQRGTVIGVSSVAGERGRQSNFIYGSAKAGFTAYLSGLRNYLFPMGIHVMTVKPGFVKTKMIKDLETPGILTCSTTMLSQAVYKGYVKRKNVVYVLPIWSVIMTVIKSIPESLFKRLKL